MTIPLTDPVSVPLYFSENFFGYTNGSAVLAPAGSEWPVAIQARMVNQALIRDNIIGLGYSGSVSPAVQYQNTIHRNEKNMHSSNNLTPSGELIRSKELGASAYDEEWEDQVNKSIQEALVMAFL